MKLVDVVAPRIQANGRRTTKEDDFLAYSDEEDEEVQSAAPSTVSAETELQLYLDHNPSGLGVLEFWEKNKALFPRLYAMTRKIFCAPASTAGVERLFSVAGYLLSNRRTNLTDRNFDKLLFGHVNFDHVSIMFPGREKL